MYWSWGGGGDAHGLYGQEEGQNTTSSDYGIQRDGCIHSTHPLSVESDCTVNL